jgi:hypothetical protein
MEGTQGQHPRGGGGGQQFFEHQSRLSDSGGYYADHGRDRQSRERQPHGRAATTVAAMAVAMAEGAAGAAGIE